MGLLLLWFAISFIDYGSIVNINHICHTIIANYPSQITPSNKSTLISLFLCFIQIFAYFLSTRLINNSKEALNKCLYHIFYLIVGSIVLILIAFQFQIITLLCLITIKILVTIGSIVPICLSLGSIYIYWLVI